MHFSRVLIANFLCLTIVLVISACAQDLDVTGQASPSSPLAQPTPTQKEQPAASPHPDLGEITQTPTPRATQTFFFTELPKGDSMSTAIPSSMPQNPTQAELVMLARQNLAETLSIPMDDIQLVQFEAVVWSDGSLGCPQPGVEYPQVQREGYRILLQAGDLIYHYHGSGLQPPFLCEMKTSPAESP